ncbi:MAG: ABC transporter ATP-binding protein [Spirochaetia bacterium]|nr:ABC transporter ATP-binding protein [Spirochaetia bacterium]
MIISSLFKTYKTDSLLLPVIENFSLNLRPNSIVALVGPSGCGKTTLLKIIGGIETPDGGEVIREKGEEGDVSFLFQEPRLLPWLSILKNITIVLRPYIDGEKKREAIGKEFLELVELSEYMNLNPSELSGGMRQRVSIARAFAFPSRVMLLDEPFQSLDAELRWSLVKSFTHLFSRDEKTTIFVTHDIHEALLIADVIIQLSNRPMKIEKSLPIEMKREKRSLNDPSLHSLLKHFYT